jgi:Zn-finger nucleic acid-binding protein
MKCPVCDVPLSISSREGVEIDFCPQCRGVWLDRGELDKIIDRVALSTVPDGRDDDRDRGRDDRDRDRDRDRDDRDRHRDRDDDRDRYRYGDQRYTDQRHDKRKKKRSFLEDLFEFD